MGAIASLLDTKSSILASAYPNIPNITAGCKRKRASQERRASAFQELQQLEKQHYRLQVNFGCSRIALHSAAHLQTAREHPMDGRTAMASHCIDMDPCNVYLQYRGPP